MSLRDRRCRVGVDTCAAVGALEFGDEAMARTRGNQTRFHTYAQSQLRLGRGVMDNDATTDAPQPRQGG